MTPHHPREGWARRLPAGWKLAALLALGTAAVLIDDWRCMLALLAVTVALCAAARLPGREVAAQLRPALSVLALVFGAQAILAGWHAGLLVVLRVALLALFAALVSLTTPVSAMTEAIEHPLRPLSRVGLRPARLALAVSLAIRFLPLLAERLGHVREAQRVRGLDRSLVALAVPMIVQSLAMADDLAAAIEARGFDSEA